MTFESSILHFTITLLSTFGSLLTSLLGPTGSVFARGAEDAAGAVVGAAYLVGRMILALRGPWFPGLGIGGASAAVMMAPWSMSDLKAVLPHVPADILHHLLGILFTAAAMVVTLLIFAMPPTALA